MNILITLARAQGTLGRGLDKLQDLLLLGTRCYVAVQFLRSGWLKFSSWDSTLSLFRDEYRVPLLPPEIAAIFGTAGELFFPVLLIAGLFGRFGAAGLFALNIVAVVSYAHMLLAEGFEAALGDHVLWGFMLLTLVCFGPGRIAVDFWLERHVAARCRPQVVHAVAFNR